MTRKQIISSIEESKIIVILRGFTADQLVSTVEAMEKGGIKHVEVTFDQSGRTTDEQTAENIRILANTFAGRVLVGAGTVMSSHQVELAHAAGAKFIISPDTYEPVIKRTVELGMVSIPGAFTPTEAANAHRAGADFIKLFPTSEVKPSYFRAITAPLSHIRFLAVGGVNTENAGEYFAAGAVGIGVATGIANKKLISEENYDKVTELAAEYVRTVAEL